MKDEPKQENIFKGLWNNVSTGQAIILASIILSLAIILTPKPVSTDNNFESFMGSSLRGDAELVMGNKDSKVIFMKYSDPECPYCLALYDTYEELVTKYGKDVKFVYRHFPLTNIHPHALHESKVMNCAKTIGGNNLFEKYYKTLNAYKIKNQKNIISNEERSNIESQVGLSGERFVACMNDPNSTSTVLLDQEDGSTAGVSGTPTVFILKEHEDGELEQVASIDGARSLKVYGTVLDKLLKNK